jgi:hypothetical protein
MYRDWARVFIFSYPFDFLTSQIVPAGRREVENERMGNV